MNKATIYELARMCNNFNFDCSECPLHLSGRGMCYGCGEFIIDLTDKANEIILNWCKEHPVETRQDRFLKMCPNAQKLNSGTLSICPKIVDATFDVNCSGKPCKGCHEDYWLTEVDENE